MAAWHVAPNGNKARDFRYASPLSKTNSVLLVQQILSY